MKFSIIAQIEEVERELEQRRKVYPSLVASRSMRQSVAEFQMARLEAVRATLIWLRDNEAEIREIMTERRRARGEAVTIDVIRTRRATRSVSATAGKASIFTMMTIPADARSTAATRRKFPSLKRPHSRRPNA